MIDGYLDMAEMLVTCDGGAYTTMVVTHKPGVGAFRMLAYLMEASRCRLARGNVILH